MVSSITTTPTNIASSSPDYVRETTLRRRLNAELTEISRQLDQFHMTDTDTMSDDIAQWHRQFSRALRLNSDPERIRNEFIGLLQELLRDPISQAPLDDQTILGSDGRTYGFMSLRVHLNQVPEQFRNRSPLNPQNEERFTSSPHHIVRYMVGWLQGHNSLLRSDQINGAYQALIERGTAPQISMTQVTRIDRMRRIIEEQAQRNRKIAEDEQKATNALVQVGNRLTQTITESFAPVTQRIQSIGEQADERLDNMEESDRQQLDSIERAVTQLENDIGALTRANESLASQINAVGEEVSAAKLDDMRLQQAINETRKAIKDRKKAELKKLITTVAIIGICVFATWALAGTPLASGAMKAIVLPKSEGAMLKLILTI